VFDNTQRRLLSVAQRIISATMLPGCDGALFTLPEAGF